LLSLVVLVNFSALLQIVLLLGLKRFSIIPFIVFCAVPAFLLPYWFIQTNKNYKQRFKDFEYLKANEFSRERNAFVIAIILVSIFFNAGIAIIRNITDSQ